MEDKTKQAGTELCQAQVKLEVIVGDLKKASAAKKVRKGGIGSALRTFPIFGSAFGPLWSEKVGIFTSRDEKADI